MRKLSIVLALLSCGSSALAAPLASVAPSWTGFYIGGQAGGGWSRRSDSWVPNDPLSALLSAGTAGGPDGQPLASPYRVNRSGVVGGFEAGYNWQVDRRWVLGVEADFSGSKIKGSGAGTSLIFSGPDVFTSLNTSQSTQWYGTVRGRVGWLATPKLLIFGTGGLAYGRTEQTATLTFTTGVANLPFNGNFNGFSFICVTNAPCYSGSSTTTKVGWAAGAGIEWLVDRRWSTKVEYQLVDLGSQTVFTTGAPLFPGSTASSFNVIFKNQFSVLRLGLNYRF